MSNPSSQDHTPTSEKQEALRRNGLSKGQIIKILEMLRKGEPILATTIHTQLKKECAEPPSLKTVRMMIEKIALWGEITGLFTIEAETKSDDTDEEMDNTASKEQTLYHYKAPLSQTELSLLLDSYAQIKGISTDNCQSIMRLLHSFGIDRSLMKTHFQRDVQPNLMENQKLVSHLQRIRRAIRESRVLTFAYGAYGHDRKLYSIVKEGKEKIYTVYPIELIVAMGRIYLICRHTKYTNLSSIRVDRIVHCAATNQRFRRNDVVPADFSAVRYLHEHPYLFTGEAVTFRFTIPSSMINNVFDTFGTKDINIQPIVGSHLMKVETCAGKDDIVRWALQYSDSVKVISPPDVVDAIREKLQESLNRYQ